METATQVPTVGGGVAPGDLGTVLMHEHVVLADPGLIVNLPHMWDEDAVVSRAISELRRAKACGVDTIVDLTVMGLGRDVRRIQHIGSEVDINIIVATGFYVWHDLPLWLKRLNSEVTGNGVDPLFEIFVREYEHGIADTGIRPCVLKCVTERYGVTPDIERILRVVARAHLATGMPIVTHTSAGMRRGLDQQAIFREEGVDLGNVVVGHCGDTQDVDYLRALADAGAYIGMDRFGMNNYLGLEARVETVARLCRLGYAPHMVLSTDFGVHMPLEQDIIWRDRPQHRYSYLMEEVVPRLKKNGVSREHIRQMLVQNPRQILSRAGPS